MDLTELQGVFRSLAIDECCDLTRTACDEQRAKALEAIESMHKLLQELRDWYDNAQIKRIPELEAIMSRVRQITRKDKSKYAR